ncbi:hypothetical protein GCM10027597_56530 [Saccharopolyspora tripterygii]
MGDRPPLSGSHERPPRLVEPGDEFVELIAFRTQVIQQRAHVGHADQGEPAKEKNQARMIDLQVEGWPEP